MLIGCGGAGTQCFCCQKHRGAGRTEAPDFTLDRNVASIKRRASEHCGLFFLIKAAEELHFHHIDEIGADGLNASSAMTFPSLVACLSSSLTGQLLICWQVLI